METRSSSFHSTCSRQVEHIQFPVVCVDTHRPRPASPTHKRLRVSSETAAELSDRTAAALSLGEDDTVVSTVGGPQFRLE